MSDRDGRSAEAVRLTVTVSAATADRLTALSRAAGDTPPYQPEAAAAVIIEQYAPILSDRYCFAHRRDGCGDQQGQHRHQSPEGSV